MKRELVITEDGSHTIYVPELKEHDHSIHGAVRESTLVFIKNGLEFCQDDPVLIFEAGFGTGLNALLACIQGNLHRRKIIYTSVEKYPLGKQITGSLNYNLFTEAESSDLLGRIHNASWGTYEAISEYFTLRKLESDLVTEDPDGQYNLIFFDAFGPDKQPVMWTNDIFGKISRITLPGGIFVTYSSKGDVKRALKSNGFTVELLPGPPGKREMIRAIKL